LVNGDLLCALVELWYHVGHVKAIELESAVQGAESRPRLKLALLRVHINLLDGPELSIVDEDVNVFKGRNVVIPLASDGHPVLTAELYDVF
jgi:hypothetical protein